MSHLTYLGVLGFILLASGWLEVALRTRVCARWRRLLLTVVPVALVFLAWDAYAVATGQWDFDPARILGVRLPGGVPLDEALFFLVVPVAAVLTLEAVRAVRGWPVGDEAARNSADGDQAAHNSADGDQVDGDRAESAESDEADGGEAARGAGEEPR